MLSAFEQYITIIGYAIDFSNNNFSSLYPKNNSYGSRVGLSTMLPPVIMMAFLIYAGFPPEASFGVVLFLIISIGIYGVARICKNLNLKFYQFLLLSLIWYSSPIVWNHSGYTHLHFAFLIFPFLIWLLHDYTNEFSVKKWSLYSLFVVMITFTDGYTAAFYLTLSITFLVNRSGLNLRIYDILSLILPWIISYILYNKYIDSSSFGAVGIDFFRGWGLDLSYLIFPTDGVHLIGEIFDFSFERNQNLYFGDESVWVTTFLGFFLILPIFYFIKLIKYNPKTLFLYLCLAFSIVMSTGSVLKFDLMKTGSDQNVKMQTMPEKYIGLKIVPDSIYTDTPVIKSMRASYRWIFLSFAVAWFLVMLNMSVQGNSFSYNVLNNIYLSGVLILFAPNLMLYLDKKIDNLDQVKLIDNIINREIAPHVEKGDRVVFYPFVNDFLMNYIPAYLDLKIYNAGGDKNFNIALKNFPTSISQLNAFDVASLPPSVLFKMFEEGVVDSLVLTRLHIDNWCAGMIPKIDILRENNCAPFYNLSNDNIDLLLYNISKYNYFKVINGKHYVVIKKSEKKLDLLQEEIEEFNVALNNLCLQGDCLKFQSGNKNIFSEVGNLSLVSKLGAGFLVYGPYIELMSGFYKLTLYLHNCSQSSLELSNLELVSEEGQIYHWVVTLDDDSIEKDADRCSFIKYFKVDDLLNKSEIRLFVNDGANINFLGYELKKIKN